MSIITRIFPLFVLFLLVNSFSVRAEEPKVDPTFAGGKVITNLTQTIAQPLFESARSLAVQADGKIVVIGKIYTAPTVQQTTLTTGIIRYNPDGSIDQSFGNGGYILPTITKFLSPQQVAITDDNKIVVVGEVGNLLPNSSNSTQDLFFIRLNSDGSVDSNFGNNGQLTVRLIPGINSGINFNATNLQILPNGDYQVTGIIGESSGTPISVRSTKDGQLDNSYGQAGILLSKSFAFRITQIINEQDGNLLVLINEIDKIKVTRLKSRDLTADTTFANKGELSFNAPVSNQTPSNPMMTETPDHKIYVLTEKIINDDNAIPFSTLILFRFNSDGQLDIGFGDNGMATVADPIANLEFQTITADANGELLIGGSIQKQTGDIIGPQVSILMKVLSSGTLDTTFGFKGIADTSLRFQENFISHIFLQPDGKLLTIGDMGWSTGEYAHIVTARYLPDGKFDPNFGNGGYLSLKRLISYYIPTLVSYPTNIVAIQPDGKMLVVGSNTKLSAVARVNSNGSIDKEFGNEGVVSLDLTPYMDYMQAIVLQPDGKILIAGVSVMSLSDDAATIIVARLTPDGKLDTDFGIAGLTTIDTGQSINSATALAITNDGKIIIGGYVGTETSANTDTVLVKLNTDGTLDSSFGKNGITIVPISTSAETLQSLVIQLDGKILVGGYTYNANSTALITNNFVARFSSDGKLDTRFGKNGISRQNSSQSDTINDLALQSDGKIVAVGETLRDKTHSDFAVLRFLSDGSLDKSFGKGGLAATDFNYTSEYASAVKIQSDGKILVAGGTNDLQGGFGVVRYNSNGSLDKTFGANGKFIVSFDGGSAVASKAILQPDGKLVIAGLSDSTACLIRYDTNLPPLECEKPLIKDADFPRGVNAYRILLDHREVGLTLFINGEKVQTAFWVGDPGASMLNFQPSEIPTGKVKIQLKSFCGTKSDEFELTINR